MQRRDFELISNALRDAFERVQRISADKTEAILRTAQHEMDCEAIANAIARRNPSFDRTRFLRDSGVDL